MTIEEKRKFILEKLEKIEKRVKTWERLVGPELKKKVARLIFVPDLYLPSLIFKFFPTITINLFGGLKRVTLYSGKDEFKRSWCAKGFLCSSEEVKLTKFFVKNLKEKDIFYDLGANYGFYTFLALEFCKEVHSFEPNPAVYSVLKENLKNESKVFLNKVAVSNQNGITKMFLDKKGSGSSTILFEQFLKKREIFNEKHIEVKTITLDEYIKTRLPPTIIKMDVEGAESLVIEGGRNLFLKYNPIIAMEIWGINNNQEISMKAINMLKNLGYKNYAIKEDGSLFEIREIFYKELKEEFVNIIFQKK